MAEISAMFPLGLVHFPHVGLPLQVFEPRYRQLTLDCLEGDRRFGVVLIERGHEVGGGDLRFSVGTRTTIVDAGFDARGLIRLDTVGTGRIRVLRWLEDDPYPRADVEDMAEPVLDDADRYRFVDVERRVRRALAMRTELAEASVPHTIALDPDPACALFQLAAIAPLGPVDKQQVLEQESAAALLDTLGSLIDEELAVLASRLAGH